MADPLSVEHRGLVDDVVATAHRLDRFCRALVVRPAAIAVEPRDLPAVALELLDVATLVPPAAIADQIKRRVGVVRLLKLPFATAMSSALRNLSKHGISFEEAKSAFRDPLAELYPDPDHSAAEDRELMLGLSSAGRLLVVAYTRRGLAARIISARMATRQ